METFKFFTDQIQLHIQLIIEMYVYNVHGYFCTRRQVDNSASAKVNIPHRPGTQAKSSAILIDRLVLKEGRKKGWASVPFKYLLF